MISPQELQNKKFEKAVFGGYDMAGIDEFLDELIPDYTALYKENMTLKNKMKVLVDKIEEYRSVDEEMRKALYSAQVSSKEIVQKAQSESEQMLAAARVEAERLLTTAHAEAEGRVANVQQAIREEESRLEEAREVSSSYAQTVIELLKKSIMAIEMIARKPGEEYAAPAETSSAAKKDDLEETRVFATNSEKAAVSDQTEKKIPPKDDSDEADSFKSSNLQFGRDYKPEDFQL